MARSSWFLGWLRRHARWCVWWLVLGWLVGYFEPTTGLPLALLGFGPGLLCWTWHAVTPAGYERLCAAPLRRAGWRMFVRCRWYQLSEACGLAVRIPGRLRWDGSPATRPRTIAPRLRRVRARGHLLELTIRARAGQTVEDLDEAAPRLAATLAAVAHRTRPVSGAGSGCTTIVELVMADALTTTSNAVGPGPRAVFDHVRLGRTQAGQQWTLQMRGRHTLIAGCSGSGKGSVLWGICCGLAPAVRTDLVRLWGVDLKRGVELGMGGALFSVRAYSPPAALEVLRALIRVIDERGATMVGSTRLHEPTVGDPLHVLVVDELAALTAYADPSIRREAERLLSEILTQGRALGVVVIACAQDPRKEVVSMRGLFTQTVALRLRSAEETTMVLGDGMSKVAPAHRISPAFPGTAWLVEDTGAADRVRADFWPDDLIREVSTRYASTVPFDLSKATDDVEESPQGTRSSRSRRRASQQRPSAGGNAFPQEGVA